jgi:hypothetical protein
LYANAGAFSIIQWKVCIFHATMAIPTYFVLLSEFRARMYVSVCLPHMHTHVPAALVESSFPRLVCRVSPPGKRPPAHSEAERPHSQRRSIGRTSQPPTLPRVCRQPGTVVDTISSSARYVESPSSPSPVRHRLVRARASA